MSNLSFNVRVYGIVLNENNEVLLSNEDYKEFSFLKFPGGGLEYGEGTLECLMREYKEEAGMDIEISEHFYTTDFFQKSMIDNSQILSIYYFAKLLSHHSFPLKSDTGIIQYYPVDEVLTSRLPLPIDKVVAAKLWQFIQGL